MDLTFAVLLLFRWIHVFGAIILVGGLIFQYCVLRPARSESSAAPPDEAAVRARARWRTLVMLSIAMLLISGFVNLFLILARYKLSDTFPGSAYHATFGVKFLLALAMFFFSSRLVGRSVGAERFRQREGFWSSFNLVLAVLVVCLAGLMKLADRQPKQPSPGPATSKAAALVPSIHFVP